MSSSTQMSVYFSTRSDYSRKLSLDIRTAHLKFNDISDSVISLQEGLLQFPAQESCSQLSGRMESPTPSAGEHILSHSNEVLYAHSNNTFLLKWMKFLLLNFVLFIILFYSAVYLQTTPLPTHRLQTAQRRREIKLRGGKIVSPLPNSTLQTSPQPARTGCPTPSCMCAWSASVRSSPWWVSRKKNCTGNYYL